MSSIQSDHNALEMLVYSDNSTVRREVIEGVGRRPAKGMPTVTWTEAATADGAREKISQTAFDVLVLDAETKKLGGMGLAHELLTELDKRPAIVLLTARPQDAWLASWAQVDAVVSRPLDPAALQEAVAQAARRR